ncbi:MAG: UvrD-helicase domain-containing protein, partial [Planctomycetes bacterium]|nr:UvrD-helicase domain-containing protein [Planctomycetota bacterium]
MTPVKKTLQTKSLFKVNYEQQLNPQQLEVVMAGRGPMLVIAGPGSGKTRTVTYRVARLIESGVHPESILLVTFTNKAARSMLTRVAGIVPIQAYRLWGGTFHHIGNKLLRKHAKSIGYQNNFTILDREDSKSLVDDIRKTIKLDVPKKNFPKSGVLINLFNYAVSTDQPLAKTIQQKSKQIQKFTPDIVRIFNNYTEKKFKQNLMDFDDLLLNWKKLFEEHPRLRETYAKQFEYILVDEYQDT